MKKVFLKWLGANGDNGLTTGREYAFEQLHIANDFGTTLYTDGKQDHWQSIEREVFTAHNQEWFKHVPGDPVPCHGASKIDVISDQGNRWIGASASGIFESALFYGVNIIGWRYADTKPESPESDLVIEVDDVTTHREMLAMDAEPLKSTDNMGVSKPVVDEWIKRENEFTEKQQAKQEAEAQKEQAKAEQMAQAGEVFSREYGSLNDHRLGCMQCGA